MPQRIKDVYGRISSFDGLLHACRNVEKGHRYDDREVRFWNNLEENLHALSSRLRAMDFPYDQYYSFFVYEPKLRWILSSDYDTKLIQRSAYDVLNPLLCRTMIYDSTSCIEGRGNLHAAQRVYKWVNYLAQSGRKWYYYKTDIWKFFYRIDHMILSEILEKKISDKRTLALLLHYVNESSIPFGMPEWADNPMNIPLDQMLWDCGISIGGGLSHLEGNLYLDGVDQLAKRTMGIKYYIRHADDILFFGDDKSQMHEQFDVIKEFIQDKRKLRFNNKTALRPIDMGVEFVGYWIAPGTMRLRKSTTLRMKRQLRKAEEEYHNYAMTFDEVNARVMSYKGMMKHCDCDALDQSIFDRFLLTHEDGDDENERSEPIGAPADIY